MSAPSGAGNAQAFVDNDDTARRDNDGPPVLRRTEPVMAPANQAVTIVEFYEFIRPKVYHRGSW